PRGLAPGPKWGSHQLTAGGPPDRGRRGSRGGDDAPAARGRTRRAAGDLGALGDRAEAHRSGPDGGAGADGSAPARPRSGAGGVARAGGRSSRPRWPRNGEMVPTPGRPRLRDERPAPGGAGSVRRFAKGPEPRGSSVPSTGRPV